MIQRFVYQAMVQGLLAYQEDPSLYTELFGGVYALSANEIAKITATFQARPPRVTHGYDRHPPVFPQYLLLVQSESQPTFALGDYGGPAGVTALATGQQVAAANSIASLWQHNIQIIAEATSVETTLYMHEMAKSIILAAKPYFQANHIDIVTMAGSEFTPESDKYPDFVYARALSFRCWREFKQQDTNDSLARAFVVTGMERPTVVSTPGRFQLAQTFVPPPIKGGSA